MKGVVDGFSTYDQLRTINSGQFFWSQTNVPFDVQGRRTASS